MINAEGVHPVPCRTRQLSPHAPMVLRFASRESRSSPVSLFFSSFFFLLLFFFSLSSSSLKSSKIFARKITGLLRKILPAADRLFCKRCSLGLLMFLLSSWAFSRPLGRKIDLRASQMRILKRQSRNYSTIFKDKRYHFVPLIALHSAF